MQTAALPCYNAIYDVATAEEIASCLGRLVGMRATDSSENDARWMTVSKAIDMTLKDDDSDLRILLAQIKDFADEGTETCGRAPGRLTVLQHRMEDLLPHLTKPMTAGLKGIYDQALDATYKTRHPKFLASLDVFDDWQSKIEEHDNLQAERLTCRNRHALKYWFLNARPTTQEPNPLVTLD